MVAEPKLLVVDDEQTICQGCERIFAKAGFAVENSSDPREGLELAGENEYAAILLDMKMPNLTGIQFLEQLRERNVNVPVIVMTGFPSVPNALSAARLGIAEYVTKPFTPEEIVAAVRRTVNSFPAAKGEKAEVPNDGEFRFFGEAWMRTDEEGAVRVGAMIPRPYGVSFRRIRLPQVGETVQQGQPLAALTLAGKDAYIIPAPVTGVVVAVNPMLEGTLAPLWDDPCGDGWIACIAPQDLAGDMPACKTRDVVLLTGGEEKAELRDQLAVYGCKVHVVTETDQTPAVIRDGQVDVVLVDAASLGAEGPGLVMKIRNEAPAAKVIVIGTPGPEWERAYRTSGIYYYTVEPFEDKEIITILHSVFPQDARRLSRPEDYAKCAAASQITVTTANGETLVVPLRDLKIA